MQIVPLERPTYPKWDEYVRSVEGSHFGQLTAWKELVEETFGCHGEYWLAAENGAVRGILPLFRTGRRRPVLFSAPGGLHADSAAIAEALLESPRQSVVDGQIKHVELRDQTVRLNGLATNLEHCTLVIELERNEDDQWRALSSNLRNKVRKGMKSNHTVHWGRDQLDAFHRVLLENLRDLGTPVRGPHYFRRVLDKYPDAEVLVIQLDDEPAAAMVVIGHGDCLYNPWASTLRKYSHTRVNDLLYWQAIRRAIALGYRRFDMGRSQWNSGTYQYKTQWGAAPVQLYYQYIAGPGYRTPSLADQRRLYSAMTACWRRLPLSVARFLGEPARRQFPEVL